MTRRDENNSSDKSSLNLAHCQHDAIYSNGYYRKQARWSRSAAVVIADSIKSTFAPTFVVDLGCGSGFLLKSLAVLGTPGLGFELSSAALEDCRRNRVNCRRFDLSRDRFTEAVNADVAVSLEVGEHLPESAADHYIDLLCSLAPIVVFSAATPGQGGRSHLNEQPHDYWIEKMRAYGRTVDWPVTLAWRARWEQDAIAHWYYRNVLVLRTESNDDPMTGRQNAHSDQR